MGPSLSTCSCGQACGPSCSKVRREAAILAPETLRAKELKALREFKERLLERGLQERPKELCEMLDVTGGNRLSKDKFPFILSKEFPDIDRECAGMIFKGMVFSDATSLTEEELKALFNPEKTRLQFSEDLRSRFPSWFTAFERFDRDHDGAMSREEFLATLAEELGYASDAFNRHLFEIVDVDQSGVINKDKFRGLWHLANPLAQRYDVEGRNFSSMGRLPSKSPVVSEAGSESDGEKRGKNRGRTGSRDLGAKSEHGLKSEQSGRRRQSSPQPVSPRPRPRRSQSVDAPGSPGDRRLRRSQSSASPARRSVPG